MALLGTAGANLAARRTALVFLTPRPDSEELENLQLPSYGLRRRQLWVEVDEIVEGARRVRLELERVVDATRPLRSVAVARPYSDLPEIASVFICH